MADKFITPNLRAVIGERSTPGVTMWNRLEGRPRTETFERALRAEVRDALWMITRQWQMGEFRGDDAGSPIAAKVRVDTTPLRKYAAPEGKVERLADTIPLETRVEQLPIPFAQGATPMSLDIRLLMGRYWLKLVTPLAPAARAEYIAAYPVDDPDPGRSDSAKVIAHAEVRATVKAVAGRAMDGAKLYAHLTRRHTNRASDGIRSLAGLEARADALGARFVAWFDRLFAQPVQTPAWRPDRLEYQFSCSAPEADHEKVLVAEEYFSGRIEWYTFDVDRSRTHLGAADQLPRPSARLLSMLPANVTFGGMPHSRWWTFEDGRTNFGEVRPDTTDLAKLLLIEFGLVYSNDWHIVPCTIPAGTLATLRGIAVSNVFGERTWIEAAGAGTGDDWQRWAMFLTSVKGSDYQEVADLTLVLPPVAHKITDGPPIEEVLLARDEVANMVWGIERMVPMATGDAKPGREAADEMRRFIERELERRLGQPPQPPPAAADARVRYQVMSSVPENWIPFIPVHVPGDNREVQLQRASLPRLLDGDPDPPAAVRPRTWLLRHGLDRTPPAPYFLHEEEVPRAGIRVSQRYRRTRWRDGRVWVWLAAGKQTGRGESSSGLAFDRLVDVLP